MTPFEICLRAHLPLSSWHWMCQDLWMSRDFVLAAISQHQSVMLELFQHEARVLKFFLLFIWPFLFSLSVTDLRLIHISLSTTAPNNLQLLCLHWSRYFFLSSNPLAAHYTLPYQHQVHAYYTDRSSTAKSFWQPPRIFTNTITYIQLPRHQPILSTGDRHKYGLQ